MILLIYKIIMYLLLSVMLSVSVIMGILTLSRKYTDMIDDFSTQLYKFK